MLADGLSSSVFSFAFSVSFPLWLFGFSCFSDLSRLVVLPSSLSCRVSFFLLSAFPLRYCLPAGSSASVFLPEVFPTVCFEVLFPLALVVSFLLFIFCSLTDWALFSLLLAAFWAANAGAENEINRASKRGL